MLVRHTNTNLKLQINFCELFFPNLNQNALLSASSCTGERGSCHHLSLPSPAFAVFRTSRYIVKVFFCWRGTPGSEWRTGRGSQSFASGRASIGGACRVALVRLTTGSVQHGRALLRSSRADTASVYPNAARFTSFDIHVDDHRRLNARVPYYYYYHYNFLVKNIFKKFLRFIPKSIPWINLHVDVQSWQPHCRHYSVSGYHVSSCQLVLDILNWSNWKKKKWTVKGLVSEFDLMKKIEKNKSRSWSSDKSTGSWWKTNADINVPT